MVVVPIFVQCKLNIVFLPGTRQESFVRLILASLKIPTGWYAKSLSVSIPLSVKKVALLEGGDVE